MTALLGLHGAIGLAILCLAYLPARAHHRINRIGTPGRGRITAALLIDLCLVGCIVLGPAGLVRAGTGIGDLDGFVDALVSVLAYVAVSRPGVGCSGGGHLPVILAHHNGIDSDPGIA